LEDHHLDSVKSFWAVSHIVKVLQHSRDGVSPCSVVELSHLDMAVCPRRFYWFLLPWKFQGLYEHHDVHQHEIGSCQELRNLHHFKWGCMVHMQWKLQKMASQE